MLRRPTLEALSIGVGSHGGGSSVGSPASNQSPHSATKLSESGKFVIGGFEISREGVAAANPVHCVSTELSTLPESGDAVAVEPAIFCELQPLEIIGRGASGFVRRAIHKDGRAVAVKDICISDPARRKQIFNEISLLRAQNPNQIRHLIQYLGVRYLEGSIQIAMEYMDAGSLGDLLQRVGPLSQECMGAICRQTLLALDELKERHLVHRDLKPQNILLNLRGECKVSDFGCVAELQDSFGKCGTFVGTVPYMSPERINGDEYSYASDVWSLGLTLVECAQGHFPYARFAGYWGILQAVLNEPSPSLAPDQFCTELRDFADYCLRKNPEERPSARILLQHPFIKWYGEEDTSGFSLHAFLMKTTAKASRNEAAPATVTPSEHNVVDCWDGESAPEVEEELIIEDETTDQGSNLAEICGGTPRRHKTSSEAFARSTHQVDDELQMEKLQEISALLDRNVVLEGEIASARQELQALHHTNSQLELQLTSSQQLIVQLREAASKGMVANPEEPRRTALGPTADADLVTLDPRRLDRLHPLDLERLATQAERNLQEIRGALRRRGRKASARQRPASSSIAVSGGRAPMMSRPMSVNSSRNAAALSHLPRAPSPPSMCRPPSAASSERRTGMRGGAQPL